MDNVINQLNSLNKSERLSALRELRKALDEGRLERPKTETDVNNHIHTIYSFSPYSPSKAVWMSYTSGLSTAGIIDHDSVSGVLEFIEAGEIIGLPTTIGFELRVSHANTALGDRRTNNPDQRGVSYLTFHGLPHSRINEVSQMLISVNEARGLRNREMCIKINSIFDVKLDYDIDVLPLSQHIEGGSVTERHLLFALAKKLIAKYPLKSELVEYLKITINIPQKIEVLLTDNGNKYYEYDLLGLLKSELVQYFYIPAGLDECPNISHMVDFANKNGIIVTYPYLGDVTSSVTGDKKAQTFEDEFLDELFVILSDLGFHAISYMPSRNTSEQLERLRSLCAKYDMFQISGEDINTPRQNFVCEAMRDPRFNNLLDNTWALIGHEHAATKDLSMSFVNLKLPLHKKIEYFKGVALSKNDILHEMKS